MALELTLRRLSKLVSKIDSKITEYGKEAHDTVSQRIFVHDAVNDASRRLDEASETFSDSLDALLKLVEVRTALRTLVGAANHDAGVNALVTKLRGLEQRLSLVESLRRRAGKEARLSLRELENRLKALSAKNGGAEITFGGYGRNRDDDSHAHFATLNQDSLDVLLTDERELKSRIEFVVDQLERINTSVTVPLSEELGNTLIALELISDA